MKEDLQHRLRKLAWDFTAIGNFNYASEYGFQKHTVHRLARGAVHDFPDMHISSNDEKTYPIISLSPHQSLSPVDPEKLESWEKRLKTIFRKLRSDTAYKNLLQAYNQDDQSQIAELLPFVFCNLQAHELFPAGSPQIPELFHGVRIPEKMNPEQYLEFCLRLQRQGLKASPYGLHIGLDQKIRPVFATTEKDDSHGLLVFSFRPKKYTVLIDRAHEARIYTKCLQTHFNIWLKDIDTVEGATRLEEIGIDRAQARNYSKKLEDLLTAKNISFQKTFQPYDE